MNIERLEGARILIVEDEYLVAAEIAEELANRGAQVVAMIGDLSSAVKITEVEKDIDAAVLDVNIGGMKVWPLADALRARSIPFVLTTGYGVVHIPEQYEFVPRLEKPYPLKSLSVLLASSIARHPQRNLPSG